MRKGSLVVLILLALLLVGSLVVGGIYWKRLRPPSVQPAALLPAETIALVEATDLTRTALRWRSTQLYQLWNEPEMQTFFAKALNAEPHLVTLQKYAEDLQKLWPRQAFIAVVAMRENTPLVVGGFSFQGDRKMIDRFLEPARIELRAAHPAGKADIQKHGDVELQTFIDGDFQIVEAESGEWHFFANDAQTLHATLDKLQQGKKAGSLLEKDELFQRSFKALPGDPDLRTFARLAPFANQIAGLLQASSPDPKMAEQWKKIEAIAATSKVDGELMRDSFLIVRPKPGTEPLPRAALALTTPETVLYYSSRLSALNLPAETLALLPFAQTAEEILKKKGVSLADLPNIYGPELSAIVQKPGQGIPDGAIALSVRSPERAAKVANGLTDPSLAESAWTKQEGPNGIFYKGPDAGLLSLQPTATAVPGFYLVGLSEEGLAPFLKRPAGTKTLETVPAFQDLSKKVVTPTDAFTYLDLGAIVESQYNNLRPVLGIGLGSTPQLSGYFDAGQLPTGPTLARHLGAIVSSQGEVPEGSLTESLGAGSPSQLIIAVAAGWFASGAKAEDVLKLMPSMFGGDEK